MENLSRKEDAKEKSGPDFAEAKNYLHEKLQAELAFYREKNTQLREALKKLRLMEDELSYVMLHPSAQHDLDKLVEMQEKFECEDANAGAFALSLAEKQRKEKNYVRKLQLCIKAYSELNKRLGNDLKTAERDFQLHKIKGEKTFAKMSDKEMEGFEAKIKRYENELVKFKVKYPWLKDATMSLPKIQEKTNKLEKLRLEKESLLKVLEVFQGLKPDLQEAKRQLADMKEAHDNITKLLYNY